MYTFQCKVCDYYEVEHDDRDDAEDAAVRHLLHDHGYDICKGEQE